MRVTITLPQECKALIREEGAKYHLHICPLMFSRAATVDLEQVRVAAVQAYEHLSGGRKAPRQFGIELQCDSIKDMTFHPTKIVPFDGDAQMITKVRRPKKTIPQTNKIFRYLH